MREDEMPNVAVIIPAFRVADSILDVIRAVPEFVSDIVVVDDGCPEGSGKLVEQQSSDSRIRVLFNKTNQGVGGAMIVGYGFALSHLDADIIVKLDGDGQMDPSLIGKLIVPIASKEADYVKGNRFDSLEDLEQMPRIRIFGNAVLSLFSKFSTGYWNITDPTNGFTAIHRSVLERIELAKLRKSYFFESDIQFRLSIIRAVVLDMPMKASYGDEKSNLNISRVAFEFPRRHFINLLKRIFYNYYLREWNAASIELPLGILFFIFGFSFGIDTWITSSAQGVPSTAGQVMLSAVPIILGFQLLLSFLNYDISSIPRRPRQLD